MNNLTCCLDLLEEISSKDKKICIETLLKIHRNIANNSSEEKYKYILCI